MCQLSYINLKNNQANLAWLFAQSAINSQQFNQDGWGVYFTEEKALWKTEKTASTLVQVFSGAFKDYYFSDSPIISHVRAASPNNGQKIISRENTHPFEGTNLVLAHNGSLYVDYKKEKLYPKKIDSEIFAIELEKDYLTTKDVPTSLKNVYKEFDGKFAFIVFDKNKQTTYIARGETADLHIFYMYHDDIPLYVVNTVLKDLELTSSIAQNILDTFGYSINVLKTKPVILEKNSIFICKEDTVEKIDELVENKKNAWASTGWWKHVDEGGWVSVQNTSKALKNTYPDSVEFFRKFVDTFEISYEYLDHLLYAMTGKGLLYINFQDYLMFSSTMKIISETIEKNIVKEWKALLKAWGKYDISIHKECPELQFPYFLNSSETLREVKNVLSKKK